MTKIDKNSQNFIKIWPKTVLFRNIALIFSLEKPCYLENRVVREPCKRRSACISLPTLKVYFQTIEAPRHFQPRKKSGCETHKVLGHFRSKTFPAMINFQPLNISSPIFCKFYAWRLFIGEQLLKNYFAPPLHCKYTTSYN